MQDPYANLRRIVTTPARAMKTYAIRSPVSTHTRSASCAEVDCPNWRHGFRLTVDETTDLGMMQAAYVRAECRPTTAPASPGVRRYDEARTLEGLTTFTFPAGQECFPPPNGGPVHRVPLDRPELFIVRGGDFRGNPTGETRRHVRAADWVEDCATHQDMVATRRERG